MKFVGEWMELGTAILCEETLIWSYRPHVLSLILWMMALNLQICLSIIWNTQRNSNVLKKKE